MEFSDFLKAIIPLLIIVGLLYGALLFVKKYGIHLGKTKKGSVSINVISSQMIMPKKFISVVKVEDKLLVLGVSDHSITLLKEFEETESKSEKEESKVEGNNFLSLLKKNLGMK